MGDNSRNNCFQQPNPPEHPAEQGSDKIVRPELGAHSGFAAHLPHAAEAVDSFDRLLQSRLWAAPIPEGYHQRLLAVLKNADREGEIGAAIPEGEAADATPPVFAAEWPGSEDRQGHWSRRRWLRWAGAALAGGTAAAIVVHFARPRNNPRPLDRRELMQSAGALFESQEREFGTGYALEERQPAEPYRLSRDVLGRDVRWRRVVLADRAAIAFDMRSRFGDAATLFVLVEKVMGLPQTAPSHPLVRMSRTTVAAWYDAPLTFVLVVQGDAAAYRRFLAPIGPVA